MGDIRSCITISNRKHVDGIDHLHVFPKVVEAEGQRTIKVFSRDGHLCSLSAEKLNFGSE
ncbi:hypothetical protein SDC9_84802 [bioreactor metagenome]|uniref:Uncharacterized protein n=1 Tax=bioreactor metagenome TaxID=1076179 RepID=A0A644ZBB3_9ZZZZ